MSTMWVAIGEAICAQKSFLSQAVSSHQAYQDNCI